MARPKVSLIAKRAALEAALDIIDSDGLEALSIRRLAERLHVNGASLYHHFRNKEEIVVGAAKLALEEVRVPHGREEPWRVWLLRNAQRLRTAFRDHPDLVPVMLRREPLGIGSSRLEATATLLRDEGVPVGAIAPMLEALELFAIGNALHEAGSARADTRTAAEVSAAPNMSQALAARSVTPDEVFTMVCELIVDATVRLADGRPDGPPAEASPGETGLTPRFTAVR